MRIFKYFPNDLLSSESNHRLAGDRTRGTSGRDLLRGDERLDDSIVSSDRLESTDNISEVLLDSGKLIEGHLQLESIEAADSKLVLDGGSERHGIGEHLLVGVVHEHLLDGGDDLRGGEGVSARGGFSISDIIVCNLSELGDDLLLPSGVSGGDLDGELGKGGLDTLVLLSEESSSLSMAATEVGCKIVDVGSLLQQGHVRLREDGPLSVVDELIGSLDDTDIAEELVDGLAPVRSDRGHDDREDFDPLGDGGLVQGLGVAGETVLITNGEHLEESELNSIHHEHTFVSSLGLVADDSKLVHHNMVPEAHLTGAQSTLLSVLEDLLDEVLLTSESKNSIICDGRGEVGIIERITGGGKTETSGISTVELKSLSEGKEVTSGLGHLLVIDHEEAVRVEGLRHAIGAVVPDSRVVIQRHDKVVVQQVLAGDTEVEGVPELKLATHALEDLLRDANGLLVGSIEEDVVEEIVRELLGLDLGLTHLRTVENATLEEVGDGVVGHIDG